MNRKVIMSIDAGGTKTKAALINYNCQVVYEQVGKAGSPAVVQEKAMMNIFELIEDVYNKTKDSYELTFIQMGVSALSVIEDKTVFEKALEEKYKVKVSIENDAYLALYSIIQDKFNEGLVVLAGTGSAVCGKNKEDEVLLNGGWGHLLTEDGSSYRVVRDLIVKMIDEYESGEEICPLGKKLMNLLNVDDLPRIRVFIYKTTKTRIATYSQFVSEEALKGDKDAIALLKKAGVDLAKRVVTLSKKLKFGKDGKPFAIGYRGSFITKAPFVREELENYLEENNVNFALTTSGIDPIIGGYYIAKSKGIIR